MPKQVRVERAIRGEAGDLYDLISDLPRMGEEQKGGITSVVETWTDQRPPVIGTVVNWMIGVRDRAERNRRNMEATLANLAAAVEV